MPYDVDWMPPAERDLANLWLRAGDRAAVTGAQHKIDAILAADPFRGRLLSEGLYVLRVPPLTVYYEILEKEQIVKVTDAVAL